jgi:hypothetical protein
MDEHIDENWRESLIL